MTTSEDLEESSPNSGSADITNRKKFEKPPGRPVSTTTQRLRNIAVLYDGLARLDRGEPLVQVLSSISRDNTDRHERINRLTRKRSRRTILPKWRELGWQERSLLRHLAIHRTGRGFAFSVNFGNRLASGLAYGDTASRNLVRNRIGAVLRRTCGDMTPYTMALDVDAGGRIHMHGALAADLRDLPRIESALKRAGGEWASNKGGRYQVDVRPLSTPETWSIYNTRVAVRHGEEAGRAAVAGNRPAQQLAAALYSSMRLALLEHSEDITPVVTNFQFTVPALSAGAW